jgi:4'-phosphopantetheinyl transferase EntD
VALGLVSPLAALPPPLPEEEVLLSPGAAEKRRREFSAGRAAARIAMANLGVGALPVLREGDRAPLWPAGLVGSLSHTRDCAVAVLAREEQFRSLGVDVEADGPLDDRLLPLICSDRERAWLQRQDDPGRCAKLIFSAKEAAYKCQYPLSRRLFGFDGMQLDIDLEAGAFEAEFTADQPPFQQGAVIQGRFALGSGIIATLAELRR